MTITITAFERSPDGGKGLAQVSGAGDLRTCRNSSSGTSCPSQRSEIRVAV